MQIFKKVCSADFEKEKNEVITNEQLESYENAKICRNWKKRFKINILKINKYCKVIVHCYYTVEYGRAAHSICHLKYSTPKENHVVFHNGSNCDYH